MELAWDHREVPPRVPGESPRYLHAGEGQAEAAFVCIPHLSLECSPYHSSAWSYLHPLSLIVPLVIFSLSYNICSEALAR